MLIKDVLHHKGESVVTISMDATTLHAVEILNDRHIGSVIITGPYGEVVGVLSERDILTHFQQSAEGIPVSQIMMPKDRLVIAHDGDTVEYAMAMMTEHRVRHLPVFEDDRLVGLVSIGDIMKAVASDLEFETKVLEDYIAGSQSIIH